MRGPGLTRSLSACCSCLEPFRAWDAGFGIQVPPPWAAEHWRGTPLLPLPAAAQPACTPPTQAVQLLQLACRAQAAGSMLGARFAAAGKAESMAQPRMRSSRSGRQARAVAACRTACGHSWHAERAQRHSSHAAAVVLQRQLTRLDAPCQCACLVHHQAGRHSRRKLPIHGLLQRTWASRLAADQVCTI